MKLIIDETGYKDYQPTVIMSKFDPLEFDLSKFPRVYVFLDIMEGLERITDYPNVVLLIDRDVMIRVPGIEVEKINYVPKSKEPRDNILPKVLRSEYIRKYVFG